MAEQADKIDSSDDSVNLVNPTGKLVSVPASQQQSALKYGYRMPTGEENADLENKETYGTGSLNKIKAGALGAAGTFSFGLIPEALSQSGAVPSEEQAALAHYNPKSRLIGQGLGIAGQIGVSALTGGASTAAGEAGVGLADVLNPAQSVMKLGKAVSEPIERGLLGNPETASFARAVMAKTAAGIGGAAAEGAIYGAGAALDEHALGNPEAMGENLIPSIGYSALLSGISGGVFSGAGSVWHGLKAPGEIPGATADAYRHGIREAAMKEGAIPAEVAPVQSGELIAPTSFDEIQGRIKNAQYQGIAAEELPQKGALMEAVKDAGPLDNPVNNLQVESLTSRSARDYYKSALESQTPEADAFKAHESLQKRELTGKLSSQIKSIAPTEGVTSDATRGGDDLVKGFTDQYQQEKEALKEPFQRFKELGVKGIENPADIIDIADKSIPGASEYIQMTPEGVKLAPYKASMPFSKVTHGALEDLVQAANDEKISLDGFRNIRENLRNEIDFLSSPKESAEISSLRKNMMSYMEAQIQKAEPSLDVRDTFKRYAMNEENRSIIEKIMGGSISDRASFAKSIKSEEVLDKLFSNSVSVSAAKGILPAPVFNKAAADYLSMKVAQFTDAAKGGFSSNKFATLLRSKEPELVAALGDHPEALKKIRAFTDIMRILPDSPSINPSGTAKTLNILGLLNKASYILNPGKAATEGLGEGLKHFASQAEKKRMTAVMDQVLAGKSIEQAEQAAQERMAKASVLGVLEKAAKKGAETIRNNANAIFDAAKKGTVPDLGVYGGKLGQREAHKKTKEDLYAMMSNPGQTIDRMDGMTKTLYAFAPNTASSLQGTMLRASQFLHSKLPKQPQPFPLSDKFEPSSAEVAKFEVYHNAIKNPVSALQAVKTGTLTSEVMEALHAVYPKALQQMQGEVLAAMTTTVADHKQIPYGTKLSLAMFLGQPLDATMTPQSILAAQQRNGAQLPSQQQAQGASTGKHGSMKDLGKVAKSAETPSQALVSRRVNRKS